MPRPRCQRRHWQAAKNARRPPRRVFDDSSFRDYVENVRRKYEQIIDTPTRMPSPLRASSAQAKEKAEAVVHSSGFLAAKRDELTALGIYYSQPYRRKELTFQMVQEVAEVLAQPPYSMSVVRVWEAYERLSDGQLSVGSSQLSGRAGAGATDNQQLTTDNQGRKRSTLVQLTDLVALIRFELGIDTELRPYADTVRKNFQEWAFRKQAGHIKFSEAQMAWLHLVRDHIATSVHLDRDDLELGSMGQQGGLGRMHQLFGAEMEAVIDELNETLAA
jgi:type I restriction enzyme R subunit